MSGIRRAISVKYRCLNCTFYGDIPSSNGGTKEICGYGLRTTDRNNICSEFDEYVGTEDN